MGQTLYLTVPAHAGGIDVVENGLAVASFRGLEDPSGTGDQVDPVPGGGDALEVAGHRSAGVGQLERLSDGTVPPIDLEDDPFFIVVGQQPVVHGHGQTGDLLKASRQLVGDRLAILQFVAREGRFAREDLQRVGNGHGRRRVVRRNGWHVRWSVLPMGKGEQVEEHAESEKSEQGPIAGIAHLPSRCEAICP